MAVTVTGRDIFPGYHRAAPVDRTWDAFAQHEPWHGHWAPDQGQKNSIFCCACTACVG